MASKVERLRKAYEFKLGKELVSKLSDEQIQLLSSFYNSLSEDEQRSVDSDIFKGKSNDLIDMARAFAEENDEIPPSAVATEEAPPPSGALALYEGTREEDLVDEEIDERILKLLGLEEVFDIDYGTYLTLLKEQMVAARMTDTKLSTEESELLTNEFRRVKGKVGRFKLKKKKIAAESLGVSGAIKVSPQKFFLTSKAVIPEPAPTVETESSKDVKDISEALDELLANLRLENKREKKKSEEERKDSEKKKRKAREVELEKPAKKILSAVKRIVAPFQSILDRIMRFIGFTLLGYFVNKVLNWFADPENQKKVQVLGRFLKDWWPSLAFAAGLFLTPFGGFVRGTIRLIRTLLPRLISLIAANPITSLAVAGAIGAAGAAVMNEQKREEFAKTDPTIVTPKETRETGKTPGAAQLQQEQILQRGLGGAFKGGGKVSKAKSFFGGGGIEKEININEIAYEEGGEIDNNSGLTITGAGPDTQLIAAQPGEIVISKSAVDKYGANFFLDLNRKGGGTNIPRMVNNIQLARDGGMVGGNNRSSNPFAGLLRSASGAVQGLVNRFKSKPQPQQYGPQLTPDIIQRQRRTSKLTRAAQTLIDQKWSYASRGGDAKNGCAPAIAEVYRKAGISLPWSTAKRPNYVPDIYQFLSASKNFKKVSESRRSPGDIVVWKDSGEPPGSGKEPYGHIGIVMPDGRIANNSSSRGTFTNLMSPGEARSGWPHTKELIYFRHNFMSKSQESSTKPKGKTVAKLSPSSSSVQPVGTPGVSTKSQTVFLPPQQVASNKPNIPVKTGTQIPDFKPVASVPYRSMVLKSLGIDDLMGVG